MNEPRRGRPPRKAQASTAEIRVFLTKAEKEKVKVRAGDIPLSAFVRSLLLDEVGSLAA